LTQLMLSQAQTYEPVQYFSVMKKQAEKTTGRIIRSTGHDDIADKSHAHFHIHQWRCLPIAPCHQE